VGRVKASVTVPGRAAQAESVWYDRSRWASWIDGFGHLAALEGPWPQAGARRVWDSPPGGRGRVVERVERYESRVGQVLRVEDERLEGTQEVRFEPSPDSVKITLSLDYALKERSLLTPLQDLVTVRRPLGESLRRTVRRFASELAAERQFGRAR
jgi:polyketide cyclase/dehydrase/lipid transport protein